MQNISTIGSAEHEFQQTYLSREKETDFSENGRNFKNLGNKHCDADSCILQRARGTR
jgi:hypothetical protein